jgi:hypothetical protein
MSDRKYRQRGYQDDGRAKTPSPQREAERTPREFRAPNMPGFRQGVRCARCGQPVAADLGYDARCERCGGDLHTCGQCVSFDPAARFECAQPIAARVSPKDVRNACEHFAPRVTVERETGSTQSPSARSAFDDLFK